MKDEGKTKKQLINELGEIRLRILELEEFKKEHKQSVVSLKDSEEKFRLIGENTSDLISIVGLNGKYVYVSPSYKLFGYDPDKLIGKDGFKILHPEDKKQFLPMIKQAISGIFKAGEERRLDIRLRDKAGNYHDVESIAKLIKNDSGNIQILSVVRDVTEQRQAEKEIENSRNQLDSIFKAAPAGIGVVVDRKFQFVNSKLIKMLGYTKEELIGNLSRMVYANDAEFERVGKYKYEQIKEKGVGTIETIFQCKDGSLIDVLLSSSPINLKDLAEGVTFTAFDVTESKQVKEELQEKEATYRLVRENTSDLISIVGLDGKFIYVSPSYKLLGYDPEELIGVDGLKFLHPKDKKNLYPIYKQVVSGFFKDNKEKHFEFRFLDGAGNYRDAESLVKLIKDDSGKRQILSVVRDMTERKKTEEEVIQKTVDLTLLNTLNDAINRGVDLQGLIDILVRKTKEIFSSYGATILLLNDKKTHLEMKNITLSPKIQTTIEELISYKISRLAIPLEDESFYGKLLKERSPKLSKDPATIKQLIFDYVKVLPDNIARKIEKLFPKIIKLLKIKSLISAPLISEGEVIGVFEVSSLKIMTDHDLRRIEIIAGQVTALIKRLQAEGDLLKNQFLLTKAQELGQIGTWELDIQKNILTWTDEIYKIFGVPFGPELDYEQFLGYLHPDDRAYVDEKWNAALNHEPYDIEHRVIVDDAVKWVREKADIEFDTQGKAVLAIGFTQDITYRKQAMEELNRYENIVSSSTDMLALLDKEYVYLAANSAYFEAFKLTQEDLIGKTVTEVFGKEFFEKTIRSHAQQCLSGEQVNFQDWIDFPAYEAQYMDINYYPYLDHANKAIGFVVNARDITARKQAEDSVRQEQETAQNYLDIAGVMMLALDDKGAVTLINKKGCEILGYEEKDILGENWFELILPKAAVSDVKSVLQQLMQGEIENVERYENPVITSSGEERMIYWRNSIIKDENGKITGILSSGEDVTDRREAEAQLNLQSHALESAANAILITDPKGSIRWVNPAFTALAGYSIEEVVGQNPRVFKSGQHDEAFYRQMWETISAGEIWKGKVINKRKDGMLYNEEMTIAPVLSEDGEISNFVAIKQDITERVQAEETIKRQHQFTSALHDIDLAITSSQDLNLTLNILIKHTLAQLEADAVAIFLLDQDLHMLSFEVGTGFANNSSIRTGTVKLGESLAGKVALERKLLILDFENEEICSDFSELVRVEQFVTYAGAPLIAKGLVLGVIEIYQRTPLDPDPEWIRSFETLAGQAAIAIENISLFNDLQRANLELGLGYEQTIEGWAKTLEMRDAETEGHSQRVTDMTMKLARQMGIKAEELVHVRRGALLHDIGKMNVPDSIMQKEGELDGAEWEIMKKHTEYAYQFLSPIQFLAPALDIPQYHHERWDGTGYPHGLKGEQIPLPARIFAIVDVFDALCSDRPYRKAWSMKKVINHLKEQSGKHFDPAVVEAFLQIQK